MLFGQRDAQSTGFVFTHGSMAQLQGMNGGRVPGFTRGVIAAILALRRQGMRKSLPARMAARRQVEAPHLDLRLAA